MPEKTYLEGRPEPTAYHPSPEEYFGLLPGYSSLTEQILALQGVSSFSGEGKKFLPYALAGLGILAVACGTGVVGSEAPGVHPTGTAIPEIGPTSAPGSMDLMFNQPAGTVSAIQLFCAADESLCMYAAGGDDGGVVAMAPLFGPEFVNDGVNVTIRGFIPGGYQEITDPDRNGDPDGWRFNQSKIWPADLTTYFTVSEADQARFDEFLAKATTNGVAVSIDMQMDADERVTIILRSLGSDGPTVFTNTVQLEPLTVQDLLGYGGDEPVVAHEMASGGGVQFRPLAVDPTGESYNGAEVTVNGEAGTIEVGGQVINTPAETKPAPTEGAVDPLAWYSAGPNGEIVGQEGDLCLFGGTEQCFKFASPEVAVEARDGLQRVTLVMWWAESETIRAQYGTFDKFVAAIKEQPVRSDGLLMQPDEQANKDHSLVDGYNPIDPETGKPMEIDYSRYNVRVIDAPMAKAEKIMLSGLGGWYQINQSLVQTPDGKWIVKYTILDSITLPDSSGAGGLPLNPDLNLQDNALAMNQALNFLFTYMRHFENLDSYSSFSGKYPLRLRFFQVSKSAMPQAAKGTSFIVPR